MARLTVIIPARNEAYLEQTIKNVLANITGDTEIIVVLDGYLPDPQIHANDERVKFIHFQESIGQRQAINAAARQSTADYIMKLDAHCAVALGFDAQLMVDAEVLGKSVTQVPRMYNLDIDTFLPKYHKLTDYMYIGLRENGELRAEYYQKPHKQPKNGKLIDDIMCCMGPAFFLNREYFWETGGCDETHGGWGQQGIEVACKAWLSGGRLVVNKKTWFAHWFRGHIGFPYTLSGKAVDSARKYSKDLWLNDKWDKAVRPFQFMLDKFNPPGWEQTEEAAFHAEEYNSLFKHIIRTDRIPRWRGVKCIKFPSDLILYAEILYEKKPDIFIEVGTSYGGSTLFLADAMNAIGHGQVISVDIKDKTPDGKEFVPHPRITYVHGRSTACDTLETLKQMIQGKSVMVCLDGDHHRVQVKRELYFYSKMVTQSQYLVVEDIYQRDGSTQQDNGPGEALEWFLAKNNKFTQVSLDERFVYSITKGGWLCRK